MRIVRVHGAWFTDKGHTIAAGGGTRLKTIWRVFFAGCPWCAPAAAESSGCTPFAFRDRSESVSQASTIVGIGRSWKTTSTSLRISRICRFFFFFLFFPSIVMNFRDGIATETSRSWIKIISEFWVQNDDRIFDGVSIVSPRSKTVSRVNADAKEIDDSQVRVTRLK